MTKEADAVLPPETELGDRHNLAFAGTLVAAGKGRGVALASEGRGLGHLALALAGAIGLSRVYLGAHYPLDVAAGALIGLAAGVATRLLVG